MDNKNLDTVLETTKSVTLVDGTKLNLRPLSVVNGLSFIDLATKFRMNIISDLIQDGESRTKVLDAAGMLINCSDYPKDKGWQEDENISLSVMQEIIDLGISLNLPQSKRSPQIPDQPVGS